jgi:hypothetical protein
MKTSLTCLFFLAPLVAGCGESQTVTSDAAIFPVRRALLVPTIPDDAVMAEAPPFKNPDTEDCSDCHDPDFMETDLTVREIGSDHEDMVPYSHGGELVWCLDCHDTDDRDMLRLSGGELLEFEDAPRLCAQCHGESYQDWVAGIHGKRTGDWYGATDDKLFERAGVQEYMVCSNCHDSHAPQIDSIELEAGPKPPEVTK